jgi:hypothetical protein
MDLTKDALSYLVTEVGDNEEHTIDGRIYTDRGLHTVKPPMADALEVDTLNALVVLSTAGMDDLKLDDALAHVDDFKTVKIISKTADNWGQRRTFAKAMLRDAINFKFNDYLNHEDFMIGLQSQFSKPNGMAGTEIIALQTFVASLTQEAVQASEDDGMTQRVSTKKGVMKSWTEAKPKWLLAPYRTFREIEQPTSEFLLRLKTVEGGLPKCGLFEADGGAWKLDAVKEIQMWLKDKLPAPLKDRVIY